MRLVDTSAWIEWLIGSPTGDALASEIPPRGGWLVPAIVQLELSKWMSREVNEDRADQVTAFTQLCVAAPLDTRIALAAAELCAKHHLSTADAIVYATSLHYGADVLTCDAHFKDLPGVIFVAKITS